MAEEAVKVWYKEADLESAVLEIEEWRKLKKKKDPMPEELWEKAIELGEKYSLYKVSRLLGLSYSKLKRLLQKRRGVEEIEEEKETSSFIELKVSDGDLGIGRGMENQCVLELYRADGSHMKIYTVVGWELDIYRICESFVTG